MSAILGPILKAAAHIPGTTALSLLKKTFPKLKNFFSSTLASGFTANQILDYLNNKSGDKDFLNKLDELHGKSMLTPEEEILRHKEQDRNKAHSLGNAAFSYGGTALAPHIFGEEEQDAISPDEITQMQAQQQPSQLGYEEQKRIGGPMPQQTGPGTTINVPPREGQQYIAPERLSYNEPKRIGGPMPQQTGPGSVINVPPNERQAQQAQQISNAPQYDPLSALMQKYPELVQFIQREAQQGSDASTIARRAKSQPFVRKYGPMIDEIENSIDEPFEMLLERLLGSQQPRQAQGQQQGQGNAALQQGLIQAMQQLKKMRGG